MRTKTAILVTAGTLGLAAVVGAAVAAPTLGSAVLEAAGLHAVALVSEESTATDEPTDEPTGAAAERTERRVERLRQALDGLVSDGVITSAQADRVAETLAESAATHGPRDGQGHGPGLWHGGVGMALDAAADALDMDEADVLAALHDGRTLADLAEQQGVERQELVDALVDAAREHLQQAVEDGRLTQEQADEKLADVADRIEEWLDRSLPGRALRSDGSDGSTDN